MTASPADPLDLLRGPAWRNRLALAPLTNTQSHPDGTLSPAETDWLVARGEGGFGHVMTAAAYVQRSGNAWAGQLGVSDDAHLPGLTRLADALRATGATSSVQLHHAGIRADAAVSGQPLVAPWDDEAKGARALTIDEVRAAVAAFVEAAVRCERAGFDGVQVHGAHGYLVAQFMDARKNHRTDTYGGDHEGRTRFLFEVLRGIRESTGPSFQVAVRLSPERFGMSVPDMQLTLARVLASGLVDHVDLSLWDAFKAPHDTAEGGDGGLLVDRFTDIPRHGVRLGVAGKVASAADVAWCLDRGADTVTLGWAGIVHHDAAARVLADPAFALSGEPVTREQLAAERVSPRFVDYLAAGWPDRVG